MNFDLPHLPQRALKPRQNGLFCAYSTQEMKKTKPGNIICSLIPKL